MQVNIITCGRRNTRYFPALHVVILPDPCQNHADLGQRAVHSLRGGASPAPLPQTQTLVMRGDNLDPDRDSDDSTIALRITGEFRVPFPAGASVDSPACSPLKNSLPSNPCWSARELRPAPRSTNPRPWSTSVTWCNCGLGRMNTGKRVYYWFARCATTAASAEWCCGRTGAATGRPGTRTAFRKSCALEERRFRPQAGQSTAQATSRIVRNVLVGKCETLHLIRYRNLDPTVPNDCWLAGFRPDNEHHAAARSP
jgi:hypothetical protein